MWGSFELFNKTFVFGFFFSVYESRVLGFWLSLAPVTLAVCLVIETQLQKFYSWFPGMGKADLIPGFVTTLSYYSFALGEH